MSKVKLVATGDVLLHSRIYDISKKNGKYDFKDKMAPAQKLLSRGDVSIVNLESIVAGEELGLSSFPEFNNPIELAENLQEFGTDIVTNSNNHSLDYGEEGVLKSIRNLESIGLDYVGSHKSKKDQRKFRIIEKNGIKIAVLSYTAVTLGKNPPKKKEYLLNRIVKGSTAGIRREIERLKKEENPDVVVVATHFGREYALIPGSMQVDIASSLSDAGADIILGHHPHVLQPAEWITNSRGNKTFVIYSLGNFYSGQKGLYRQIGGALSIDIEKNSDSKINITNPKIDLTFVAASKKENYQMHHFNKFIEKNPYIKTIHDTFDSLEIYSELNNRLTKWMPELEVR
ncbi:poly-gamma-glutamate biosynthesis protein [Oceanobacillus sp. E9]|uniref:Capsular polysaccharide biosynthesis protein n=1 Tax=Oceanobacillus kimchii TaxID=746691 RepID=A0ABQ5TPQ6_9BACI|nr:MULTISPECIES: CapA family protein [Oceanobacillus]OEH55942.1 poly-gamma-glutamate biosynthesis protein [Oceanobacillus sp. E9]GLO67603.1 capsular polysaccharide biosynthesis protein [Oceanobacillus kimchii]